MSKHGGKKPMPGRQAECGLTVLEMLIVVTIVALMAAITYPSVGAGLDAVRLRAASDDVASFLTQALSRVERSEDPVEIFLEQGSGRLEFRGLRPGTQRVLTLPEGLAVRRVLPEAPGAPPQRSIILMPGSTFPAIRLEIANRRGQWRTVRLDPLTAAVMVEAGRGPAPVPAAEER